MAQLMRCLYCGVLQDEPTGVKACARCGGELGYETVPPQRGLSYVQAQMELDQVAAPAGRNVERHLLITLRTPAQVPPEEAASPSAGRRAMTFVAVLDVSGSMQGEKLARAKDAARQALARLHDGDYFSLVTFDNEVHCVIEPAALTAHTRRVADSALREVQCGGMTALCGGLELGIEKALAVRQETNLVLLLSDGQANVGETDIEKVGQRAYQARRQGITVSTLGVGSDYNEALMVEIATQGGGRFYHVQRADQIGAYLTGELGEVATLAAREAVLALTLPAGVMAMPLSSVYPAQQSGVQTLITVGDIPADLELEIPVRVTLPAQSSGVKLSFEGELSYRSPAGHTLHTPLNRVTVRFVEAGAFHNLDGVVQPVVERVLTQMKAASVLGVSRAMTQSHVEGARRADADLTQLEAYADLLGEEEARDKKAEVRESVHAVSRPASPAAAKAAVFSAHSAQRSTRQFDTPKKEQS